MDTIIDKPNSTRSGWSILEKDATGGGLMRWFAHLVYLLRKVGPPISCDQKIAQAMAHCNASTGRTHARTCSNLSHIVCHSVQIRVREDGSSLDAVVMSRMDAPHIHTCRSAIICLDQSRCQDFLLERDLSRADGDPAAPKAAGLKQLLAGGAARPGVAAAAGGPAGSRGAEQGHAYDLRGRPRVHARPHLFPPGAPTAHATL